MFELISIYETYPNSSQRIGEVKQNNGMLRQTLGANVKKTLIIKIIINNNNNNKSQENRRLDSNIESKSLNNTYLNIEILFLF